MLVKSSKATLREAASLREASLREASLREASLREASLREASPTPTPTPTRLRRDFPIVPGKEIQLVDALPGLILLPVGIIDIKRAIFLLLRVLALGKLARRKPFALFCLTK